MRVLLVHPSPLLFSEIYLRLEPLGLERVAAAVEAAGHEVRLLDLQVFRPPRYRELLESWRPEAIGFSLNYLANVPEVVELARTAKAMLPGCRVMVGGHSASFVTRVRLEPAGGAIDCRVRGEGEGIAPRVLESFAGGAPLESLPGVVTPDGSGPPPLLVPDLAAYPPARHLAGRRRRYFIGELDPCASVEFTRGCPWDCTFCSAWTFYGRSYRVLPPGAAAEDLASVREPNVFIVDDVAFIRGEDGFAIADEVERRNVRKRYYLETRADVLLRNREVFERWAKLGLRYMFLGIEAIDEEGLKRYRKRVNLGDNERALEVARELGLVVAINIIADPDWDERRFAIGRFYEEFVRTQDVLNRKHLGWRAVYDIFGITMRLVARGQTNFVRMLWKFGSVYNVDRLLADHARPVTYALRRPQRTAPIVGRPSPAELYVHHPTSVATR